MSAFSERIIGARPARKGGILPAPGLNGLITRSPSFLSNYKHIYIIFYNHIYSLRNIGMKKNYKWKTRTTQRKRRLRRNLNQPRNEASSHTRTTLPQVTTSPGPPPPARVGRRRPRSWSSGLRGSRGRSPLPRGRTSFPCRARASRHAPPGA